MNLMTRILRTIVDTGSLANLMFLIGFHYKAGLLIEEIGIKIFTFDAGIAPASKISELLRIFPRIFEDQISTFFRHHHHGGIGVARGDIGKN